MKLFRSLKSSQHSKSRFEEEKVFCIGLVKTGTTSIHQALKDLGYRVGDQRTGELLLQAYADRNFGPIVDFCLTANAFQDAPFSYPFTYLPLDQTFPNAKFILSVRDDVDQWYRSLLRFHGNLFAGGRIPVKDDLMKATYCYPGFAWEAIRLVWNTPEDDIYHKPTLVSYYERHNENVRDYFRSKTNLLEINVSDKNAYERLCNFLGRPLASDDFPWLNKSSPLPEHPEL